MYDVVIIGGGVCGAAIAMYLSKYDINCCLIEKHDDLSHSTDEVHIGIARSGYMFPSETIAARLAVRGSEILSEICQAFNVPYKRIGSLMLAYGKKDDELLIDLYEQGIANGVRGMELLDAASVSEREPSVSQGVTSALYAPSAALTDPHTLYSEMCRYAKENGIEFLSGCEVTEIEKINGRFKITASDREIGTSYIINTAGVHAGSSADLAGARDFNLLSANWHGFTAETAEGMSIDSIIITCPDDETPSFIAAPAENGIFFGPDMFIDISAEDATSAISKNAPDLLTGENICGFSGECAISDEKDIIIRESSCCRHFINVAGVTPQMLSAIPAIGEYVGELLEDLGLILYEKE